jgi:hypothetical protein
MSLVGGGQARVWFLLEDKEDFDEVALASASVAFLGMMILSPQQPLASGSWVGVGGGIVAPAWIAPACGAVSPLVWASQICPHSPFPHRLRAGEGGGESWGGCFGRFFWRW